MDRCNWFQWSWNQKFGSKLVEVVRQRSNRTKITPNEENTNTETKTTEREQELSDARNWGTETNNTKAQSTKVVPIVKETIVCTKLTVRVVGGPHTGLVSEHVLNESLQLLIGGDDEECDIVLNQDDDISGEHAELYWDGFALSFIDCDSTNGSKVDGRDAEPEVPIVLALETKIGVGQTALIVTME